jgi:topoisomerase-4 subunit A
VASTNGKLLVFPLAEVKVMPKGMGVQLMSLGAKDRLAAAAVSVAAFPGLQAETAPSGKKKLTSFALTAAELEHFRGKRARVGNFVPEKAVVLRMHAAANARPALQFDDADDI